MVCVRLNLRLGGGRDRLWGELSFGFIPGKPSPPGLRVTQRSQQAAQGWSPLPTTACPVWGYHPVCVVTIYLFSCRLKRFLVSIRSSRARMLILNSQSFSCKQTTK